MQEPIKISVPRTILRRIRQEAIKVFPIEVYIALLGRAAADTYEIEDIWVPADVCSFNTNLCCSTREQWGVAASEYAEEHDLKVIGLHHSHPYTETAKIPRKKRLEEWSVMSVGDLQMSWNNIQGISAVQKLMNGKFRVVTNFWGPYRQTKVFTNG